MTRYAVPIMLGLFIAIVVSVFVVSLSAVNGDGHLFSKKKPLLLSYGYKNVSENPDYHLSATITMQMDVNNLPVESSFFHPGLLPLKDIIKKDIPQIDDPSLDNWTKVQLLRQWAGKNTIWGYGSKKKLDTTDKIHYYQKNATEIFTLFHYSKGSVICGGIAYALSQLYLLYGFDTYTLDMGEPGNFTHVVTLVRIDYDNKSVYSVQDATFDVSYTNTESEPLDYFEMLNLLRQNRADHIIINKGPNNERMIISDKPNNIFGDNIPYCDNIDFNRSIIISSNYIGYHGKIFNESIYNCRKEDFQFLSRDGYPSSPLYIFMYPLSIMSGQKKADTFLSRALEITSKKILINHSVVAV